jgi:hypothetical protein
MHIVDLLDFLLPAPDVEIVESPLPETPPYGTLPRPQLELEMRACFALSAAQRAGDALLEHLQDARGRSNPGLFDEQMEMFGHDDLAHQCKLIAHAGLLPHSDEQIAGPGRTEQGQPPVATTGDEMQGAASVTAPKVFRDRRQRR